VLISERKIIVEIVEGQIRQLTDQLNLSESSSQTVQLDQSATGRVSRIDAIQQQKMASSSMIRDKKLVTRLERVLSKLKMDNDQIESDYGYCQECGDEILLARLKIKPDSKYCVDCQSLLD